MGTVIFGADNRLDQDVVTVSVAADAKFPVSNLNDDRAFTKYKMGSTATVASIKTDAGLGNMVKVDYFMLINHDLFNPEGGGGDPLILSLQHSFDDNIYTNIFSSAVLDNKIIARSFSQVSRRFFRLLFNRGGPSPLFKASFGELQWGQAIQTNNRVSVGFDPVDETIGGQFNRSRTGNLLGSVRAFSTRRARISLPLLPGSFVNDTTDPTGFKFFWDTHASKLKPFLFQWNDGDPTVGTAGDPRPFMQDAFFARIDPGAGINRPLRTSLDTDRRDLEFSVVGLKE